MNHASFTRRQWLGATAAAAGNFLLPHPRRLSAAISDIAETEHFLYRGAPDGPYIDSQRDHKAFGFGSGKIFLSEDNAKSWPHSAEFAEADHITWSCLMKNGNILFATRERLFLSTRTVERHLSNVYAKLRLAGKSARAAAAARVSRR